MFYFMTPEGAQLTFIGLSLLYFIVFTDIIVLLITDKEVKRTRTQKTYLIAYAIGCLIEAFAFSFSVAFTGEDPFLDRSIYVKYSWFLWFLHLCLAGVPVLLGTYGIFAKTFTVTITPTTGADTLQEEKHG